MSRTGGVVLGSPAVEARRAKKALTLIDSLPELKRTLAAHERRLADLERFGARDRRRHA